MTTHLTPTTLSTLAVGKQVTIAHIECSDKQYIRRLHGLGLKVGAVIEILRKGLTGSPLHVRISTTELAIRRKDADIIHIY